MVRRLLIAAVVAILAFGNISATHADVRDPLDPFDLGDLDTEKDSVRDEEKTPSQLIDESRLLLMQERPLDARRKLLLALQKDPKAYKAHLMLSSYYLVQVGHFKLALLYVKQAQKLFEEKNGPPPYQDPLTQREHAQILYLLSQVRLNLDDYPGALATLDDFTSQGYYSEWYAGTRSWVLMKLGRIEEAIKVSRLGLLAVSGDEERGHILNMLGILLSMNNERAMSLKVFREAVDIEMSLGTEGEPATPLNNMGEVYRETFDEENAETSWLRATSLKDGCEHVLPSLNLAILYLDQLNPSGAKKSMDNFEACVAQYPLRNGEEHKALVHLARGRIALQTGHVDDAIDHLKAALEHKQWFGKIGADEGDLEAAAMMSLGLAYEAKATRIRQDPHTLVERLSLLPDEVQARASAWWYLSRARQILIEDQDDLEDLYIRNTDSILEYPYLGELLADVGPNKLKVRFDAIKAHDGREVASNYYDAYLAESLIRGGSRVDGERLMRSVMSKMRPKYDDGLKLHMLMLEMERMERDGQDYISSAYEVFSLSRPALRNSGLPLPVRFEGAERDAFENSPFLILDGAQNLRYTIKSERSASGEYSVQFISRTGVLGNLRVTSSDLKECVKKLTESVFSVDLG